MNVPAVVPDVTPMCPAYNTGVIVGVRVVCTCSQKFPRKRAHGPEISQIFTKRSGTRSEHNTISTTRIILLVRCIILLILQMGLKSQIILLFNFNFN